jgi:hypothetical protein
MGQMRQAGLGRCGLFALGFEEVAKGAAGEVGFHGQGRVVVGVIV